MARRSRGQWTKTKQVNWNVFAKTGGGRSWSFCNGKRTDAARRELEAARHERDRLEDELRTDALAGNVEGRVWKKAFQEFVLTATEVAQHANRRAAVAVPLKVPEAASTRRQSLFISRSRVRFRLH